MLSLLAPSKGSVPAKIRMLRSGWSFWWIEEYSRFFASYLASGSTWTYVLGNFAQQALPLSDQVTLEVQLVGSSRTDTITVKSNLIIAKHITHDMESCHTDLESPGLGTSPMLQPSLIATASLNWVQMELISMLRILRKSHLKKNRWLDSNRNPPSLPQIRPRNESISCSILHL